VKGVGANAGPLGGNNESEYVKNVFVFRGAVTDNIQVHKRHQAYQRHKQKTRNDRQGTNVGSPERVMAWGKGGQKEALNKKRTVGADVTGKGRSGGGNPCGAN